MNSKNIAILAYLTPFGWLLALILNGSNKDEFSSFHIRQMLGLIVAAFVLGWISRFFNI